jgi:hypothetical protein
MHLCIDAERKLESQINELEIKPLFNSPENPLGSRLTSFNDHVVRLHLVIPLGHQFFGSAIALPAPSQPRYQRLPTASKPSRLTHHSSHPNPIRLHQRHLSHSNYLPLPSPTFTSGYDLEVPQVTPSIFAALAALPCNTESTTGSR